MVISLILLCSAFHHMHRSEDQVESTSTAEYNRIGHLVPTIYNCKPQVRAAVGTLPRNPAPINPGPYNIQQEHINNIMNP
jgi:hypothetical protein